MSKTVTGATAAVPVTAEGATTIAYRATDNAGNAEAEAARFVRPLDKTSPDGLVLGRPGQ